MELDKIHLQNFCLFIGKQEVDVSISESKNIVLFVGGEESGKSTILKAINWCVFNIATKNLLNQEVADSLKEGESTLVQVDLEGYSNNKPLTIERRVLIKKEKNELNVVEHSFMILYDHKIVSEKVLEKLKMPLMVDDSKFNEKMVIPKTGHVIITSYDVPEKLIPYIGHAYEMLREGDATVVAKLKI
jgi:DNA repair exonuclease SbcCD ATPase subunit